MKAKQRKGKIQERAEILAVDEVLLPEVHEGEAEEGEDAGGEEGVEDLVVDGGRYQRWVILHNKYSTIPPLCNVWYSNV